MDPKDKDTQNTPATEDALQPTEQQKADGELVVKHEDMSAPADGLASESETPSMDTTVAPDGGSDAMGTDVGNGMPASTEGLAVPEAPASPVSGAPESAPTVLSEQPPLAPPAPSSDQPSTPSITTEPDVTPATPVGASTPVPPVTPDTSMEAGVHKGHGLVLVVAIALVVAVAAYMLTK